MKYLLGPILITIFSCLTLIGQIPNWQWAKGAPAFGSNNNNYSDIAVDAAGNSYVTGVFNSDSISFGNFTLVNPPGASSVFVVKFDPTGNVLWAKNAHGYSNENRGNGIVVDALGNCYIIGHFTCASITFGSTTLFNAGTGISPHDIFLVKYDDMGNVNWANSVGATGYEYGTDIALDQFNNLYITGYFSSQNLIVGNDTLISKGGNFFVAKVDSYGNVLWARSEGGGGHVGGNSIAVDAFGNYYVVGEFNCDTLVLGNFTLIDSLGFTDIFTVKYDSSGNVIWAQAAGTNDFDKGFGIAVDAAGSAFITGFFSGPSIMFGNILVNSPGNESVFIVKYDLFGNVLWAKAAGGYDQNRGNGIHTDAFGNVYVTGFFTANFLVFDGNVLTNTHIGNEDIFIVNYDASGNLIWAKSTGGTNDDRGYNLALNANGNVLVTGYFNSYSIDFGNTTLIDSSNSGHFFLAQLDYQTDINETIR